MFFIKYHLLFLMRLSLAETNCASVPAKISIQSGQLLVSIVVAKLHEMKLSKAAKIVDDGVGDSAVMPQVTPSLGD
jgi:hypothetical protein